MKKYYLNLFNNVTDILHTFSFTERDVKSCKKSKFWKMSEDNLSNYLVQTFITEKRAADLLVLISFLLRTESFLGDDFDYKDYNSFTLFVEPDVIEFVGAEIAKDQENSIDISRQILSTVL